MTALPAPGSRFIRQMAVLGQRGKTRPVTYTVTGTATRKGRQLVTTRSDLQGEGSFSLEDLAGVVWIDPDQYEDE